MLVISCCPNTSNNGYSYGMTKSSESDILKRSRKTMYLYDTKGTMISSCSAYKGEFDGHTWYVFYGNVVHDPLCNCTKKQ